MRRLLVVQFCIGFIAASLGSVIFAQSDGVEPSAANPDVAHQKALLDLAREVKDELSGIRQEELEKLRAYVGEMKKRTNDQAEEKTREQLYELYAGARKRLSNLERRVSAVRPKDLDMLEDVRIHLMALQRSEADPQRSKEITDRLHKLNEINKRQEDMYKALQTNVKDLGKLLDDQYEDLDMDTSIYYARRTVELLNGMTAKVKELTDRADRIIDEVAQFQPQNPITPEGQP